MKDEFISQIGVFGQMHYQHLKENKPTVINVMRMKGSLRSYLKKVDEQANEMLSQLVSQMAKAEGVTEELKAKDQMKWVCLMENIRNRAMEIVCADIIYV